jgi:hypothetical protein
MASDAGSHKSGKGLLVFVQHLNVRVHSLFVTTPAVTFFKISVVGKTPNPDYCVRDKKKRILEQVFERVTHNGIFLRRSKTPDN